MMVDNAQWCLCLSPHVYNDVKEIIYGTQWSFIAEELWLHVRYGCFIGSCSSPPSIKSIRTNEMIGMTADASRV